MEKYVKLDDVKELLNQLSSAGFAMMSSGGFKAFDVLPTKELDDLPEGTWEEKEGSSFLEKKFIFYCSECGDSGSNAWSYCPHCGAKMKKKSKEIKYVAQQGITGTINRNGTSLSAEIQKHFII